MNKLNKILSLSLAATSILSTVAFADFSDSSSIKFANKFAVNSLADYTIISGDPSGKFLPTDGVTRAEMAKMIAVMVNKGEITSSSTSSFSDTKGHWADRYIAFCVQKGIINGKTATTFEPESSVTGTEAMKMLLIALGLDSSKASLVGAEWENNSLMYGSIFELDYDIDYSTDLTKPITRELAAQMISNSLSSNVAKTVSGTEYAQGDTSLRATLGYSKTSVDMTRSIYNEIDAVGLLSASMAGQTAQIATQYIGISSANVLDVHLSITMMSPGIDEVCIAKVVPSKMSEVEKIFEDRIEYLINSKSFYPQDKETAEKATIYKNGDYIMLYVSPTDANYKKVETLFNSLTK